VKNDYERRLEAKLIQVKTKLKVNANADLTLNQDLAEAHKNKEFAENLKYQVANRNFLVS